MTLPIFPTLDGIEFNTVKHPEFKTSLFESLSGNESRVGFRVYPKYTFTLNFEFLLENRDEQQLSTLLGFFMQQRGQLGTFLYVDPDDSTVTNRGIGGADGVKTDFPLTRGLGGFVEPLDFVKTISSVFVNGVEQVNGTDFARVGNQLSFTAPPPAGALIVWSGEYYFKCRFVEDSYDFTKLFMWTHECRDLTFIGSVRDAV